MQAGYSKKRDSMDMVYLPSRADKLSGTRSRGGSSPNPAAEKCDMGRLQNFCAKSGELCVGNLIATTPI